jgi:hypothetical protein
MTRLGFSSLPEGTQIEKDRKRCGKPIFDGLSHPFMVILGDGL